MDPTTTGPHGRPASLATSKSILQSNDISPILADNEDYKTTTSNKNRHRRLLIRTILKRRPNTVATPPLEYNHSSHPDKGTTTNSSKHKTKVKVFRRRVDVREEAPKYEFDVFNNKLPISAPKKKAQKKKKVLLKRKLNKSIETAVELKTRPRTYTYFVTRKNGEGNEEFVSSSTEVRDFTYSITVSKTVYQTENEQQVMTSLVPTTF